MTIVVPAIDAIDGDIVFGVSVLIKNRYRLPIKASLSKAVYLHQIEMVLKYRISQREIAVFYE